MLASRKTSPEPDVEMGTPAQTTGPVQQAEDGRKQCSACEEVAKRTPSAWKSASMNAVDGVKKGGTATVGCCKTQVAGFRTFLLRGNLVDLAVAVVVGASFTALVNAVVADFLTPLIAIIFQGGSFADLYFTINGAVFNYGHFINVLLTFVITCAVLYFFVVVPFTILVVAYYGEKKKSRDCPECRSPIPEEACRCKFCCAAVVPKKIVPKKDDAPDEVVTKNGSSKGAPAKDGPFN